MDVWQQLMLINSLQKMQTNKNAKCNKCLKKFHQKDIPTQTIYMDNIFVSKTEKRLIKLIDKAK